MKSLRLLLILCGICLLSSCVDIEERYDFRPDGSCNITYGFDMSKAVSILTNLLTDSVKATPQFAIAKDTSLNLYAALPDSSAAKLSAEEMRMASASKLAVNMDLKRNVMKVSVKHEAKNNADLQYYVQHISTIPVNNPIEFVGPDKDKKIITRAAAAKETSLTLGQDYYAYEITDKKFYRTVDKSKFSLFLKKAGAKLAVAKAMFIDMPYKVVLNFTKPVRKINNPKAVISADRRQVTLETSMDDVIKNPAVMNLQIDL
ncbi:hypothetical protein FPZ43_02425 [Mucilaginibacter pallidiroseus]|uniref:Uncharacterized protein n=1 Tax=Mucilaginibacter pallidiroseus TaxID=2599295 RepID=A0A563UIZ4_9SPHI|nr:hypothetical protein [Mucilaginibacter pallidiroseus]TWR31352.1 hypothetical protein FPZ43_02425 [Mucilaginibacter pallidiroseus]